MVYERLLQQTAPFLLLMLGLLLLAGAQALKSGRFLHWIAGGFVLSGLGLGLQSLMDDEMLSLTAPFVAILYLSGAMVAARGVAGRCGDGPHRVWAIWPISALCLTGSAWFSYVETDLLMRMVLLNAALGAIYLTQIPYLLRKWNELSQWDKALGVVALLIGFCHLMRSVYIVSGAPVGTATLGASPEQNLDLTRTIQWKLMLAMSNIVCLSFGFLALLCAANDRMETLRQERDIDPLTGLLNRRGFFDAARDKIMAAPELTWIVVAGDVDFFKKINDVWGHAIGDQTLARIAGVLGHHSRSQDLVARFGGEEFIMLLGCRDLAEGIAIAEQKREVIALTLVPGLPVRVTTSFGVAPLARTGVEGIAFALDQALESADACLYQAKKQGRNRVVVAGRPAEILPLTRRETAQPA